jgi:hypothetical protein
MNARLDSPPTRSDPALGILLLVATLVAAVSSLVLLRAALSSNVDHVTLRVDNQTSLVLTLEALDRSGTRLPVGVAKPKARTTLYEVIDPGDRWTVVAAYGGREVHRQVLSAAELRASGWTIAIPAAATRELQQAGFQ